MRILALITALYLASLTTSLSGTIMWTKETYLNVQKNSTSVFNAKVVKKSKYYLNKGKKVDALNEAEVFNFYKQGNRPSIIYTTITLKVISVDKSKSIKPGQKIVVSWQDPTGSLCPHPENKSLNGSLRKWYSSKKTYKILPQKIYKKQDGKWKEDTSISTSTL